MRITMTNALNGVDEKGQKVHSVEVRESSSGAGR
jgi:hypothetical protein